MMLSRKWNGNEESTLDDLRLLPDHDLERVSGGAADLPDNLMAILDQRHQRGVELPAPGCPRF